MAIKVTRLQDVFKKKVEDAVGYPTIWIDLEDKIHTDDKCELIEAVPLTRLIKNDETYPDIVPWLTIDKRWAKKLFVVGTIIRVGSHVTECGPLSTTRNFSPDEVDFSKIFEKAKSLRIAQSCFYGCQSLTEIPEDVFANCPLLVACLNTFTNTPIKSIPENLFAYNPELNSLMCCFEYCDQLTEAPEGLFANNPNLENTVNTFEGTQVTKIPPTVGQLKQQ